jgi:polyribonucleotide nucleotidyltransferase
MQADSYLHLLLLLRINCPTQVLQWVLSYDGATLPEPLAITAASAALLISGAVNRLGGKSQHTTFCHGKQSIACGRATAMSLCMRA